MAERGGIGWGGGCFLLSSARRQPGRPGWTPLSGVGLSNFLERSALLGSAPGRRPVSPGSRGSLPRSSSVLNCWPAQQMRLLEGCRNLHGKAEAQHFANLMGAGGRQPWHARDVTSCVGERRNNSS